MLYTRKGDDGNTKDFNSKKGEKKSKSSLQMEALGTLDELNSFLGLAKVKAIDVTWLVNGRTVTDTIDWIQNNLFIVQAEVAGADKHMNNEKVREMESIIDSIENELPPINTFLISGGTELAALFDVARTIARKAERRIVAGIASSDIEIGEPLLAFMNRLSSLIYALARLINHKSGIKEESPNYS